MKVVNIILIFSGMILFTACDRVQLSVEGASGSGNYSPSGKAKIKAYLLNPGYEFFKWVGDTKYI